MEWQPIETAPKDGSEFIAFFPCNLSGMVCSARWINGNGRMKGYFKHLGIKIYPTHWMPMPTPPQS